MADFTLYVDDTAYDKESSMELRKELIHIRDAALKQNAFGETVVLSHVIAWMYKAMDKLEN